MHNPWKPEEGDVSSLLKDPLTFLFHWLREFGQVCWSRSNFLVFPTQSQPLGSCQWRWIWKEAVNAALPQKHWNHTAWWARTKAMPLAPPDGKAVTCSHPSCKCPGPSSFTCYKGGNVHGRCVFSPWLFLLHVSVMKSRVCFALWMSLLNIISFN
jgi:hypothetical protein